MKLARSTYYYRPRRAIREVGGEADRTAVRGISALWLSAHHRPAASRGDKVNHKAVARVMCAPGAQVRPLRRFVRTTNSQHNSPIFPNPARGFIPTGADQLWTADITLHRHRPRLRPPRGNLDAWSRRVVGYALGRQIDTRLTLAALRAAIHARHPRAGLIRHSDRGASTQRNPIGASWRLTGWWARWVGAAIPTTTARPKAS